MPQPWRRASCFLLPPTFRGGHGRVEQRASASTQRSKPSAKISCENKIAKRSCKNKKREIRACQRVIFQTAQPQACKRGAVLVTCAWQTLCRARNLCLAPLQATCIGANAATEAQCQKLWKLPELCEVAPSFSLSTTPLHPLYLSLSFSVSLSFSLSLYRSLSLSLAGALSRSLYLSRWHSRSLALSLSLSLSLDLTPYDPDPMEPAGHPRKVDGRLPGKGNSTPMARGRSTLSSR